ncbi:MAG TPA: GGDEF domain-containing protein [candidate division Zixibacteria bacterium]|nr:GGDEF domain-containing protein [candidate division Zixibacteria bacterium]
MNKAAENKKRKESDWDRAFMELVESPDSLSGIRTPLMVQWLIGICVVLFALLFFLGQVLPAEKSGLYLLISALSILAIGIFGMFALSRAANQSRKLKDLLDIDRATGLYSSIFLMEELDRLTSAGKGELSVIFIDLDELKQYNDKYGHRRGDQLIRSAGQAIKSAIAGHGTGFRYGGDEFVAILQNVLPETAVQIAKRVQKSFEDSGISASIGICRWRPGMSSDELIDSADKAMYMAKRAGKGRLFIPDLAGGFSKGEK